MVTIAAPSADEMRTPIREPRGEVVGLAIRVVIAGSAALYADGLRKLLSSEADLRVAATVHDIEACAWAIWTHEAHVVIVDLDAPARDALGLCDELRSVAPKCKVVALIGHLPPEVLLRALANRAQGLVSKHSTSTVLLDTVRRVVQGHTLVDRRLLRSIGPPTPLTLRELDLLRQLAEGTPIRDLAASMSLSQGTVRNSVSRIIGKLGARNRTEAIGIARKSGWL